MTGLCDLARHDRGGERRRRAIRSTAIATFPRFMIRLTTITPAAAPRMAPRDSDATTRRGQRQRGGQPGPSPAPAQ